MNGVDFPHRGARGTVSAKPNSRETAAHSARRTSQASAS